MDHVESYARELGELLTKLPFDSIRHVVDLLLEAYQEGRRLILMGNGGSAATASHLVADFQKMVFLLGGRPFRALSCADSMPLVTAWANDTAFANSFAEQVRTWAEPRDLVFAISTSGNSRNILRAVDVARECRATTIGLSGYAGGQLASKVDISLLVPCDNVQQIEDIHMILGHLLFSSMLAALQQGRDSPSR
jgi:D-sedoheptulose 7-phosphate isomerase